ncbi:MAG: hypothetical protein KDB35_03880, partial [Acidimicrobiales bacterium]|nr:hypothetical protein [Acidimicrobiales bacterium]
LLAFTRRLIELRRDHPVFQRRRWFDGRPLVDGDHGTIRDIGWFRPDGQQMTHEDWNVGFARTIGVALSGELIPSPGPRGEKITDDDFFCLFNAHDERLDVRLPEGLRPGPWVVEIDTWAPDRAHDPVEPGATLAVEGRTSLVLRRC